MPEPVSAAPSQSQGEKLFRWRGGGVSRIEGLSDGVFALALTLLMVSLQPPASFGEMLGAFRQVPVFLLTYAMFGWVWYQHHQFHRRFGLEDPFTVTWNLVLLFVVLLYVYPLRFLATALCQMMHIVDPPAPLAPGELATGLQAGQMQGLMLLYGAGFVAMFGIIAALYRHAWNLRDQLGLDDRERVLTRAALRDAVAAVCVGLASIALSSVGTGLWQFLAGIVYSAVGPLYSWNGRRTARELRAIE